MRTRRTVTLLVALAVLGGCGTAPEEDVARTPSPGPSAPAPSDDPSTSAAPRDDRPGDEGVGVHDEVTIELE